MKNRKEKDNYHDLRKARSPFVPYMFKKELFFILAFWLIIVFSYIILFSYISPSNGSEEHIVKTRLLISVTLLNSVFFLIIVWLYILPVGQKLSNIKDKYIGISLGEKPSMMKTLVELEENLDTLTQREYTMQLLQKQAELDSLQSQINPHFLYNTLDSIRGQALEEGSNQTSEMIEALSTLLRYTISQRGDMVTLGQELRSVDNYIKIQQYRFDNRFSYKKTIESTSGNLLNFKIPKLTLQPLIENSIYHGIDSILKPGEIHLEIFQTQSRLIINVIDNGAGMDKETLTLLRAKLNEPNLKHTKSFVEKKNNSDKEKKEKSFRSTSDFYTKNTGIALSNVNSRIKLAFGNKYGITAYSTKDLGSRFQITLPLREETQ